MTLEEVRAFWDRRPCNIRHSPKAVGGRAYFADVRRRKYFVEPHIPGFAAFPAWKDKQVLEVGCGIGTDAVSFALAGAWVTAVELSPVSLRLARQHARAFGVQDRIAFFEANAESLSEFVPLATYDLVYSFGVLHHTPHPGMALNEIRKYMDGNSLLKLMLYHGWSWKMLQILAARWRPGLSVSETISRHTEAQQGCPVSYTYTPKEARELLKDFELLEMRVAHIFPYQVKDYVQYRYVMALPWKFVPLPLFRWLEDRIGAHLLVTARLRC
jgi:SAM-dependent methyltransferase